MDNRKNLRTKVSSNQKLSIKQAEFAKNPESCNKWLASAITVFEQVRTTDNHQFIPKAPQKQLDWQQKN